MKTMINAYEALRTSSFIIFCTVLTCILAAGPLAYVNAEDSVEITQAEGQDSTGRKTLGRELTSRPDDERPEEQLKLMLFGRPLTAGGEYNIVTSYRKDFSLADDAEDDILRVNQEMEFEFLYEAGKDILLFLEIKPFYNSELYSEDGDPEKEIKGIKRGETWIHFDDIFGSDFELQLGRQGFDEKREWWWDEDLDAIRLFYKKRKWRLELGVAEELFRTSTDESYIDPEEDDLLRLLGHVRWKWEKRQSVELFFLYHDDHSQAEPSGSIILKDQEDKTDADLFWIGLRAHGRYDAEDIGKFYYRFDTALLTGDEVLIDYDTIDDQRSMVDKKEMRDVSGWGLDAGITWETALPTRPRFTMGYAVGSGDRDPESGPDRSFRQTGIHDNDGSFRGASSFRYYGELLRPELSNLHVLTLAAGFSLLRDSSIEFVYHRYWQYHAVPFLRDVRVNADPLGENNSIGQEWDIVLGIEEWEHLELELTGALFCAGSAFGPLSGETAGSLVFSLTYNF